MDINLTLIIQMLVFAGFVWFTMRFVWPPLSKAMEERQGKIADGLAAAERGRKELELAHCRARDELKQAKVQAVEIIEKAIQRATEIVEGAKKEAKEASETQAKIAKEQLNQEVRRAKDELRKDVAQLAVAGAEKILAQQFDQEKFNRHYLDNLISEI